MKLALIPARGGSKRIERKNIRHFRGLPVIAYAIEAARDSGTVDRIIVSTEDDAIAEIAREFGAEVPFRRPAELADDHATAVAVMRHAIGWARSEGLAPTHLCCIYPVAPLVRATDIRLALERLEDEGADYCFPVVEYPFPIQRAVRIDRNGRLAMFEPDQFKTRSQDLEPAYHDAGQFYWVRPETLMKEVPIFSPSAIPLHLPRWRVQDIDTPEDWRRAEILCEILERDDES